MKGIKVNGRIVSTRYKSTSYYGNPKYYVSFENKENGEILWGETANNAACAYAIENSEYRENAVIVYHVTRTGNIIVDYVYRA